MGLQEGKVNHRKWQLITLLESWSSMHFCWQRRPGLDKGLLQGHQQVPGNEKASYFPRGHACMFSHFSCIWLFCDPVDCSPPGSSVHGTLQARILEWIVGRDRGLDIKWCIIQLRSKCHVTPYQEGMLSYQEGVVLLILGYCCYRFSL